jgi:hypothetical protein
LNRFSGDELDHILQSEEESSGKRKGKKGKKDKKSKKEKKEKGFFAKLSLTLFGEDEETAESLKKVTIPEETDLENISEENLQILKELEEAEAKNKNVKEEKKDERKKKKKEKKPKVKKEKKPKVKKEKKPKVKKEKPPKEPDNTPPIPKKPAILIFLMVFSILVLILLTMNGIGRSSYVNSAKQSMDSGDYVKAYEELSGLKLKKKDQSLFEKVEAIALVQEQYNAYLVMMGQNEYELALDSLVRGIGRYDKNLEIAKAQGLEVELNKIKTQLTEALKNQFGITEEEAREISEIRDREDYSIQIKQKISKLNIGQGTKK